MRILIADDQAYVRQALRIMLEQHELFLVDEAGNLDTLLERTVYCRPDVLLIDWELPGFKPAYLIPLYRSVYPEIKIVAMSSLPEAAADAEKAGADAFVSKGDSPDRVIEVIDTLRNATKATPAKIL